VRPQGGGDVDGSLLKSRVRQEVVEVGCVAFRDKRRPRRARLLYRTAATERRRLARLAAPPSGAAAAGGHAGDTPGHAPRGTAVGPRRWPAPAAARARQRRRCGTARRPNFIGRARGAAPTTTSRPTCGGVQSRGGRGPEFREPSTCPLGLVCKAAMACRSAHAVAPPVRSPEVGCGGARPTVRQHVVWPRAAAATGFRAGRGRQNVGRTPPPQRGYTRGHGAAGVGGATDHPLVPWGAVATLQLEASPQ